MKNANPVLRRRDRKRSDITRRLENEATLVEHAELRQLYEEAPCGYHSLDTDGTVIRINSTELEFLGYLRSDLVDKVAFRDLVTVAAQAAFDADMLELREGGAKSSLELDLICKDLTVLPVILTSRATFDVSGKYSGVRSSMVDITERRKTDAHVAKVELLVTTDHLTGAANRRAVDKALLVEVDRAHRYRGTLTLIVVDLDNFKQINDKRGHQAGDEALKHFAEVLRSRIRGMDLFARVGGDEFIVLMPQTSAANAGKWAENIRILLEPGASGTKLNLTASFGIAELLLDESADSLLNRADQAMYRGKTLGRNRVEFAQGPDQTRACAGGGGVGAGELAPK